MADRPMDQPTDNTTEDITAAAMWGDVSLLENFLANGADPNTRNSQGNTALHVACYYGERECASVLLNYKAEVNARGVDGKTPLHRAVLGVLVLEPGVKYSTHKQIEDNQIDLVKLLVGRGGKVSLADVSGDTPFDLAIQCDFYDCADLLTELGKDEEKMAIEQEFYQKIDDIYEACQKGDLEVVEELLPQVIVIINQCKKNNMTLLMLASKEGHLPIVECLLKHGALATASSSQHYKSALHFAAENGYAHIVEYLIDRLPKLLNFEESLRGTSLHLAAENGHTEVVKALLKAATQFRSPCKSDNGSVESSLDQPEVNINVLAQSPIEGKTPLHEAVINGHTDIVHLLVDWLKENHSVKKGLPGGLASPSPTVNPVSPRSPQTPSSSALRTPSQSNANPVDFMTEKGRTPLHEAARLGHKDMVEALINGGADINAIMRPSILRTVNTDLTALFQAAMANNIQMVRFLLQNGATDARLKALTRVLRIPHNDVAGLLLCHNGNVTVDSATMELRKRNNQETLSSPSLLVVNWASKKLNYIDESWLNLVLVESPVPKKCHVISQLNLSDNNLNDLPLAIFQLEHLVRLELSRNKIDFLPDSDWNCPKLNHFDVSHNQLSSLPMVLFTLPMLKELLCNNNTLRDLPMEFWLAPKLKKLQLQKNQLEFFPSPLPPLGDSGISTMDNLPESTLYSSSSLPEYSFSYSSSPLNNRTQVLKRNRISTSPSQSNQTMPMNDRRISLPAVSAASNLLPSRLRELFLDNNEEDDIFEELSPMDANETKETDNLFQLESLDLSHNLLTAIPQDLCCLAPKLQKLQLHHNKLKSLGTISNYPADLELLDACNNQLTAGIGCALSRENLRNTVCAQKLLQLGVASDSTTPTRCLHRHHKNMRKLSYLKIANNSLMDIQLFRMIDRERHSSDLTSSIDEMRLARRPSRAYAELSYYQRDLSKSSSGLKSSTSSNEEGSNEIKKESSTPVGQEIAYCLYPQLSTLDIASNRLSSVPSHIELISSLSILNISYNVSIDVLPLQLSNLEGLWSLEYDGVPLTNPPASDLDKFRSAADKLLYMRSLLHDAKPYESMKLMLVGLQKQGKTTLLSRLREINEAKTAVTTYNDRIERESVSVTASVKPTSFFRKILSKDEPFLSTVGVDLGMWKYRKDLEPSYKGRRTTPLRSVTFYTWDFGGQEEYYATHQCFLSSRSLYLVIFNVMDGEDGIDNLALWLHNIQARAPDSPVVIVGTHCDMLKGEIDKEQRKKELHQYLEEKYSLGRCLPMKELGLPMIKEIMFVGCPINARSEGVAELRMALWDIAFNLTAPRRKGMGGANKTKLLEQPIPSSYLKLEERVRGLAVTCQQDIGTAPVMKEVEFREKVKDVIPNFRELNQAVTFLHENGVLLHYNTPALSNLYFVDPQWLCDVLAHVVTVPEVNRFIQRGSGPEAGILKTSALFHIFKGKLFPPAFRNQYIELLEKFEVALLLDRNRMLVPSMLPSYPRHTIHHFPTIFPRPPIAYILNQVRRHSSSNEDNLTNFSLTSDPLVMPLPKNFSTPSTPDLHRTGLIMRRFYFMTYVPSGFWPRLISRFLTLSDIIVIVLNALGFSEKKIEETVKVMVSGDISTLVNMEWSYWTTGVELWYMGYSLLRVAEIRPEGTFQDCVPSSVSSGLGRTPTMPFEPSEDCSDLSFQLSGQWMAVEQTPNTGIEILVPDYICPSVIEMEFPTLQEENIENESICVVPTRETSWMSAQLFSLILQQIDTLLEDWFPGIGAKDGGKTQYSIPYVNRVVPCPYCVGNAHQLSDEIINKWSFVSSTHPLDKDSFRSSNSMNSSDEVFNESHARRDLLSSLNQQQSKSKKNSFNDDMYDSSTLVQATRFGFMIETCVAASRGLATLACPVHPSMTLDLLSLTPDLVFGDLPTHFLIDPSLVDQGKYVASGSFGEVYHGAIYPHKSASDDEGREVAIKIDKQDRKHFNMETATKAYNEIRAEVSVLKDLKNDYIVEFVGLTLQPLCFMLEWGTQGSLHDLLNTYHKVDARISPWTLVETSRQVASGLAYLHSRNIVYYDLKSPNILAFRFPTANESINLQSPIFPVHVKITDFGISRKITPGGVVGYKGTPAFMAPEILRYVGMEACTEKVDVFSFGMFMYELLAHQYPFERQNLMHNQIEKLVVDGERPTIQKKELNNPVLFLDIMRWSWSQYYRDRPSASQLESVLSSTEISQLIDAYSLQDYSYSKVTSSCVVTLPIDISSQTNDDTVADTSFIQTPLTPFHTNVVQGDLQEELWFASETADGEWTSHQISIVSFCGRTNFSANSIKNGYSVTSMCSVNQQVWVGTADGCLVIYETVNHSEVFKRYLAIKPNQKIIYISHLTRLRQVMIVRSDGCFLLFNEYVLEQKIPDSSLFDGRVNGTQLPVLGVSHVKLPVTCAIALQYVGDSPTLWCGSNNEVLLAMNVSESRFSNCQKLQARSYSQTDISDTFSHLCSMKIGSDVFVWALSFPKKVLYLWDSNNCTLLISRDCNELTTDRVTDMMVLNDLLYLSTSCGAIIPLQIDPHTYTMSALCSPIAGHHGNVHRLMSLDSRIFPKHWIPTLIGRSNVIEYYRDLLDEEEIADISSRIIGRQCRLLVSVGEGFPGLKKMQLAPAGDDKENFVLLWLPLPK